MTFLQDNGVDVSWANEIAQDLKAGKTNYKTHISSDERCKDHCSIFSLSHPNNTEYLESCDHEHNLSYHECPRLAWVCDAIAIMIDNKNNFFTEEQRVRARNDHKQATKSIHLWKAYLLHTVTQGKAKQDILANLDHEISANEVPWTDGWLLWKAW